MLPKGWMSLVYRRKGDFHVCFGSLPEVSLVAPLHAFCHSAQIKVHTLYHIAAA